eukprot:jgi/Psemu1/261428/estExt_Genewise1Plus.C_5760016
MGVVANWADHVRHFLPWSGPMHFIDVRDDLIEGGCHYQYNASTTNDNEASASSDICEFDYYHRDCEDSICAAGAISNYSAQLIQQLQIQYDEEYRWSYPSSHLRHRMKLEQQTHFSTSKSLRQALMFLIHFVGDIHQPLHVSRASDRGGNDIPIKYHPLTEQNSSTHSHYIAHNLHSVWDTAMIKTTLERDYRHDTDSQSRYQMAVALESLLEKHPEWLERFTGCEKGSGARHLECVIGWGQESWSRALKYAYTKNSPWENASSGDGVVEVASGDVIDNAYYSGRIPVVRERLIAAAVRLAATLEAIFGRKYEVNDVNDAKRGTIQLARWTESIRTWSHISHLR